MSESTKPFNVKISYGRYGLIKSIEKDGKKYMDVDSFTGTLIKNLALFSTADSPNITRKEYLELRKNMLKDGMWRSLGPSSGNFGDQKALLDSFEQIYADKESDGGEDITPKEINEIFNILLGFLGYKK